LTTPFFDEAIRPQVIENVRNVLVQIKAQPGQGYKRLMDEVGLSTRNASAGPNRDHGHANHSNERRPGSQPSQGIAPQQQYGNQFYPPTTQASFDMQRTESVDSNMSPYGGYSLQTPIQAPMFPTANVSINTINPINPMQYQQNMMGRGGAPVNNFFPNMNGGFAAYNNPAPTIDQYRNAGMPNSSPMQAGPMAPSPILGQNGFAPSGYGMGYGFGGMGMANVGYLQQQQEVNGRRGRVSYR
jgi:protein JSN1